MADDLIELIAAAGTDEVNHGMQRFRVDNTGRVRVPREAAHYLIRYAGFRPVPPPPDPPPPPADEPPAPAPAGVSVSARSVRK
jgi:hypothetical protein